MSTNSNNETLWTVLRKHGWLTPAVLSLVFTSLAVLFGFIHDSRYFGHFGVTVLDYTSPDYYLKSPFRNPAAFLWAVLTTFIAAVNLWLLLSGRFNAKLGGQLSILLTSIAMLYYGVYISIEKAADSAASSLGAVTVKFKAGSPEPSEGRAYLMIGRIGTSIFLCEESTGKPIVRDGSDLVSVTVDSPATTRGRACWVALAK
jgi:hypothetical protein